MRSALISIVGAFAAMLFMACGGGDSRGPTGGQCEYCRESQPRCDAGLTCRGFYNQQTIVELCANPGTSSCRVPD
jgi:hypothetical protein